MKQRIKAVKRNSKKGFTLVELVIVIAILAVLAGISIPVITTIVNSSKLSVMQSDAATMNMVVKEAVNTSKVELRLSQYNGKTAMNANIGDVCIAANLGQTGKFTIADGTFFTREIGSKTYQMVYTTRNEVEINSSDGEIAASDILYELDASVNVSDLDPK